MITFLFCLVFVLHIASVFLVVFLIKLAIVGKDNIKAIEKSDSIVAYPIGYTTSNSNDFYDNLLNNLSNSIDF